MKNATPDETYHGMDVLAIHVGDALPTPPYPVRYAVRVAPDLARYLLTFNHAKNRDLRPRKIRAMASDMIADRWLFAPHGLVFDLNGTLNDGQHRLLAIIETGVTLWVVVDFGWPIGVIRAIDRGTSRTTADMLGVDELDNASGLSAGFTRWWQYQRLVGTSRGLAGFDVPTSMEAEATIAADLDAWHEAVNRGSRIYRVLEKGASASAWSAFFRLAAESDPRVAAEFYAELHDGTGSPKSATRQLADWFRRRPMTVTKTGDAREPLELMIRAWNAWLVGKSFAFPRFSGFELSRVRGAKV